MAYIGTSPTQAVRTRFLYTATASQTTFSGADTQNLTLRYSDANFVDVYQNGVLLKGGGADYTATTTTSVVLATGATADDVIEIIVYDVFAVANLIKKDGDTVEGVINFNGKEITLDADFDTSITSDTDDQIDFKTGGTDRVVIDSSGNVGIADTTPEVKLTVVESQDDIAVVKARTTTANGRASYQIGNDADNWFMGIDGGNSDAFFIADAVGSGDKLIITQAGNVGIGTTSPATDLSVSSSGASAKIFVGRQVTSGNLSNTAAGGTIEFGAVNSSTFAEHSGASIGLVADQTYTAGSAHGSALKFSTASDDSTTLTERMRVDSTGNFLVGTTSSSLAQGGIQLNASGRIGAKSDGLSPLVLNRTTSDGIIIELRKDGSKVGQINTEGDDIAIGTGDVGLQFLDGSEIIAPFNMSTNSRKDNSIDLGGGSERFDDIFATNGTIQTSDQNEKQDIASATAKELNVAKKLSALFKTFRWKDKVAEKGDKARTHTGIVAQEVQSAFSAEGLDASNYGLFTSDTWTNEEGKKQTRLGVRYPELFSFIFSSIEARLTALESK